MDFVERIFHVSPDQGSGSYEALLTILVVSIVVAALLTSQVRKRRSRHKRDGDK